jgi:TatD DNase family protein
MLADSHCHLDRLDLQPYHGELRLALEAAHKNKVEYILCPGIDIKTAPQVLKIAAENNHVVASIGQHPTEEIYEPTLNELLDLGSQPKVVAIGETGLDFYRCEDESIREYQRRLFKLHICAAKELNKPLIIHSREAGTGILKILTEEKAADIGGVMHCFTENWEMAEAALQLNFYISFSGIITFKNAENLRNVAKKVPLKKILIETDAPYLAPAPHRGKPNEPAFLHYTANFMANLLNISSENFATITTENFLNIFATD